MATRWIYGFDELAEAEAAVGGSWDAVRSLLGGKGANLADMTRIGLPVPPGFVVTTTACNAFLAAGERFPEGLWEEERAALGRLEATTGKRFGDRANPLLVSCRSGSKFSMPGMMDTVLNIGLNDAVAEGMGELTGDRRFAYDSYRRLVQMFGSVVMGIADEPFDARRLFSAAVDSQQNNGRVSDRLPNSCRCFLCFFWCYIFHVEVCSTHVC
jgi:pyruvate,orthophosphate dikinase